LLFFFILVSFLFSFASFLFIKNRYEIKYFIILQVDLIFILS
jgi:hypothetical protein